ncbi:hypothetical protein B0H17DRAFT_1196847 [Mycena rosella]|uniref:Stealth protein CR3 conserved region 3 domain-containing protein n=1 Tax=Mycena rosella TaxID=1033263 RepID=A0AAD7GJP8_MYCRO|nr:hypothetical protein B0H17DRAFT_1196847 [Mycena rosella]
MPPRPVYLYQTFGGKPPSRLRELFIYPVRCTAIRLIVALSLGSIGFLVVQQPWGATFGLNMLIPGYETDTPEVVSTAFYHSFVSPSPADSIAEQTVRPIKAQSALPDKCLDIWVSTGQWQLPCRSHMVQDAIIDLVYVWVNGSDVLHQKARGELLAATKYKTKDARFREHDELRYSLRSARNATASWPNSTWHVITADVPDPSLNSTSPDYEHRLGLVPQWLDVECTFQCGEEGNPRILLQHDTQLFRLTGSPGAVLGATNASEWLNRILPSFNSHAVESQLPQLDPEIVSENVVVLNDDQFMLLPLPPSAFHTTLYGPVFRVDLGLMVRGDSSGRADGGGEWRSLGWSSHLLNERFGTRKRPYIHHNARALCLPLMHEMSLAFGSYFAATPLSQFRGSHKVAGEYEVNTIFMATHYVIERHREALLWSWVVAKWGGASGMLDQEQKMRMWRQLGGASALSRWRAESGHNLLMGWFKGYPFYRNLTVNFSVNGGYSSRFPAKTVLKRGECIGQEPELAWDMFQRLLRDLPACGDAIIATLTQSSKSGLSVFLPPASRHRTKPSTTEPIILPLELPPQAPPLPSNPRAFAVRLLMRYAYVLGDSPTVFIGLKSSTQGARLLKAADRQKDAALLCINDDLGNGDVKSADEVLHGWFERRWPEKLPSEGRAANINITTTSYNSIIMISPRDCLRETDQGYPAPAQTPGVLRPQIILLMRTAPLIVECLLPEPHWMRQPRFITSLGKIWGDRPRYQSLLAPHHFYIASDNQRAYQPRGPRGSACLRIHAERAHKPTSGEITEIHWGFTATDPATFTLFLVNSTQAFDLKATIGQNLQTNLGEITTLWPVLPSGAGYQLRAVDVTNVDRVLAFSPAFAVLA